MYIASDFSFIQHNILPLFFYFPKLGKNSVVTPQPEHIKEQKDEAQSFSTTTSPQASPFYPFLFAKSKQ